MDTVTEYISYLISSRGGEVVIKPPRPSIVKGRNIGFLKKKKAQNPTID